MIAHTTDVCKNYSGEISFLEQDLIFLRHKREKLESELSAVKVAFYKSGDEILHETIKLYREQILALIEKEIRAKKVQNTLIKKHEREVKKIKEVGNK